MNILFKTFQFYLTALDTSFPYYTFFGQIQVITAASLSIPGSFPDSPEKYKKSDKSAKKFLKLMQYANFVSMN